MRQHLRNRLAQFRRQIAGGNGGAQIGKQWRQAFLLGGRGLRRDRHRRALQRGQRILRCDDGRTADYSIGQRIGRKRHGVGRGSRGVAALPDHGQADSVPGLRDRELQRLALLQRNFGGHIDREAGDSDPHQIGGEDFQDLRIDHASRLQHEFGRNAANLLGGKHGSDGIDGDRHNLKISARPAG